MKLCSYFVLALGFLLAQAVASLLPAAPPRPNIIVIVPDDLGWRDIGYHDSDIETPHLDRLAASGVKLEQHYVFPTCSPTRIALLAGRNPARYGVHGPIAGNSKQHLPPATVTLPAALRRAGYSTHISGKWHLGLQTEFGPTKYGFETSYGYLHGQIDPYNHLYKFGDRSWHRNDELFDEAGHATDLITAEAVRFIRQQRDQPFFLYVAYSVPHHPLQEPDEWVSKFGDKIKDPWRRLFAASIAHMDDGVGRIVAALDETDQRAGTLIVFVSDNGGQRNWNNPGDQYDGRYQPHKTLGDNRPLRGWKGDLYEGGVRVPAFAHWPEKLPADAVAGSVTSVLDWMPTLAALAGAELEKDLALEGVNIWPQLAEGRSGPPRTLYWNTGRQLALRDGDFKLIADRDLNNPQLFNLADDPLEKTDLAASMRDQVDQLMSKMKEQRRRDG